MMWPTRVLQATARRRIRFTLDTGVARCLSTSVRCDMKLHSILLGWTGFLTKPCVSPQVFHGSMRLEGCGRAATTARGMEPSRRCSKPGSLRPGAS